MNNYTSCVIAGISRQDVKFNLSTTQVDFLIALPVKITSLFWLIDANIKILEYISAWDGKKIKQIRKEAEAVHTLLLENKSLFEKRDLLGTSHNLNLWKQTEEAFLEIMGYTGTKPESTIKIYRLKGE